MVALTDYTMEEALRRNAAPADISRMSDILLGYGVETFEVGVRCLQAHKQVLALPGFEGSIRCRIKPSLPEAAMARKLGIRRVAVMWSVKPAGVQLHQLEAVLCAICDYGGQPYLFVEDASAAYYAEFERYWRLIERYGVERIVYYDGKSVLDPFLVRRKLLELVDTALCPLEFCGTNVYGLATANTLAAIQAGVGYAGTSVCAAGTKGTGAMEEVLMALRHLGNRTAGVSVGSSIAGDCEEVLSMLKLKVPEDKALVGKKIFWHESGIHVDGILKHPGLYEVIRPEEVGLSRNLLVGKHSGTASIRHKLRELSLELAPGRAGQLLERVRELAGLQKGPLSDAQLMDLYARGEES
ncbi:hypothetical protein [Paenibacillus sp. S150]|uniref:homocitrate synthase/isopropylmalate synthase family protein n=1 Tax=Paenibacillus sp. S150 TaxID=2749826 RepID=UPI001C5899F3|nr:hypothetical protein [Paenibacillus sp. S150]MBW4082660.1 pyruvate carboxyltransferase [Paenibacillus sp. S150]